MANTARTAWASRLAVYRYDPDEIKRRNRIEDVIGRDVTLKRSGAALVGLCPFHQESNPSFSVSPARGLFHCFGCSVGGDVIRYVQLRWNLSFADACALLGGTRRDDLTALWAMQDAHAVPARGPQPEPEILPTAGERRVLALALERYQTNLWRSHAALDYLRRSRGLDQRTIREAGLGLGGGVDLLLRDDPDSAALAVGLGLVDRFGHDRYRGRIVIPALDRAGVPHWWTGRVLPGNPYAVKPEARYLDLARLSGPLLGEEEAGSAGAPAGGVLIVEGPFDWLVARGWGYSAVALTGTHPGEHALARLRSLARRRPSFLVLDADPAGREAARRLLAELDLPPAHRPGVVRLEGAKDLAELALRDDGRPLLVAALAAAGERA